MNHAVDGSDLFVGLVRGWSHQVVKAEALLSAALALARTPCTEVSPRLVRVMKRQLWEAPCQTLGEAVALAIAEMYTSLQSEDFKERVAHFQQWRPARFTVGERLDPESLRHVMGRYFDTIRAAVERHGGTVEKFIGDAVMTVFGVPIDGQPDACPDRPLRRLRVRHHLPASGGSGS